MSFAFVQIFPPELLDSICSQVYYAGTPAIISSLDPVVLNDAGAPTSLPSSYPPSYWSESVSRSTLASLCLTSRNWYDAAKPWLWRKVEVRLPTNWLAFVGEVTGGEEEISGEQIDKSIHQVADAALSMRSLGISADEDTKKRLHESIIATLSGPDSSIPPELLSPPATRDPSPRRIRAKSKSPARWKVMQSINDALINVMQLKQAESGFYVPAPQNIAPGRYVRRIDFSHFRTIGMRRIIGEAIKYRFVTSERLENVLKECPNLTAFGATEYMDGALTFSVLKELLLRGTPSRNRGRQSRGRTLVIDNSDDLDAQRRRECKDLVALDFTGCVSAVLYSALREFVNSYIKIEDNGNSAEDEHTQIYSNSPHHHTREQATFPGLQRLGLLGVKSIQPDILHPFVLAFPSLTHLDLSSTRVSDELLVALGSSSAVRLEALALARCVRLTGDVVVNFLINGQCTRGLKQLNLYGDTTYPSPLSEENLQELINKAPCFTAGTLEYLDISSSPLTFVHLLGFSSQPKLRSLGLSYIPQIPLHSIKDFLCTKAPNVEVLTLVSTSPELAIPASGKVFNATMALHGTLIHPLCTLPSTFCPLGKDDNDDEVFEAPTRLRVLELSMPLLNGLGVGAGTWRIVRSKGGRAWYVDTACSWVAEPVHRRAARLSSSSQCSNNSAPASPVSPISPNEERFPMMSADSVDFAQAGLRRALPRSHPLRKALERLAEARGNVSSGMGWHSRKMEILEGHGLLGHEDGLYGAVAFAYQG